MNVVPRTFFSDSVPALLSGLLYDIDKMVGGQAAREGGSFGGVLPVDVMESEEGYTIRVSVPGVREEDVDATLERNTLTVRVKSEQQEPEAKTRFLVRERVPVQGVRTVTLPHVAALQEVDGVLKNGVLTVHLKKDEAKKTQRIGIRAE